MSRASARNLILGFLTVKETASGGRRGGYLLTNDYGRPIEFHYTSPWRLGKPQHLLFGVTAPLLDAEVFGKPLTDRQTVAPRLVVVNEPSLLAIRRFIPAPAIWVGPTPDLARNYHRLSISSRGLAEFGEDQAAFDRIRTLVPPNFDWLEPFERLDLALAAVRESESPAATTVAA